MSNTSSPVLWRQILRQNFTHWDKLANFLELDAQQKEMILETAVQGDKLMQSFKPESFVMVGDHSQMVKAPTITNDSGLKDCINLSPSTAVSRMVSIQPRFPLNLPMRLAQKIAKGTLDDPILRQFLPTKAENDIVPGFGCDPVGDQAARKESKLLHKYEGRVLLVCTSACAMHCRYCFRQNFDYDVADNLFVEELEMIASDPSIHEVILSGGDPLSLSDSTLQALLRSISKIPHINRIRFHTRFPIGIPERLDENFLAVLAEVKLQIWFIVHANHPKELDDEVMASLKQLQKLGVVVMNQAVLLRGVNDDVKTLKHLCERLVDHGVVPYYLHQLDRVQGASHFEVQEEKGKELVQELAKQLAGYAIPKFVREMPGVPSKTLLR